VTKPKVSDLFGEQGRAFPEQVALPNDECYPMDEELLLTNFLDA